MDVQKLDSSVLGSIRQSLGCDEADESKDGQIAAMGPLEAFDRYLSWNGIIGFASTIWEAVENIKEASSDE